MKTYYDLTDVEKKNYEKEFKKTPGGKTMNKYLIIIEIIDALFVTLYFIVQFSLPLDTYNYDGILDVTSIISWGSIFISIVYNTYFQICFCSWLKNKYDIKRW